MKDDPLITFRRKPASIDIESLEAFGEQLRRRLARGKAFHCRITSDTELQSLNRKFRKKDYPTDVLSFPAETPDHIGDIAISLGRARAQAREYGHTVDQEIRILLLHGVLHLLGFDHETDSGDMERTETGWRKRLDLPNGLIQRTGLKGVSK